MPDSAGSETPKQERPRYDDVVSGIRDMIIEGELTPGPRISERALCDRFGVSRTPLREALKVLASEGLVELTPNRGARVIPLTEQDAEDMFEVMGTLEGLAGELATQQITDEQIAELKALHYQMALHHTRRELMPYFRLNQEIHRKIFEIGRNKTLISVYRGLAGRIRRPRYLANISLARWAEALKEHEAILAALEARNGQALGGILKDHLRKTCDVVKQALRDEVTLRRPGA
ncbi:MAG: GntR family transcriptional regulator [Alphaproteobacteria bacterium]